MIHENDNLEKNVSRLVKLADDSCQPNKNFTDSLINSAIDELTQKAGTPARERKSTIMTAKKIFAYAASILVICGVLIALMTQNKNETKRQLNSVAKHESAKTTITAQKLEDEAKSLPTAEKQEIPAGLKEAQIEYTQAEKLAIALQVPVKKLSETKIAELIANAEYFQKQHRYEDALKQLEMVLAVDPNNVEILNIKESVEGENKKLALSMKVNQLECAQPMDQVGDKANISARNYEFDGKLGAKGGPADSEAMMRMMMAGSAGKPESMQRTGYGVTGTRIVCNKNYMWPPLQCPARPYPPMAHGGTTPPNGEDVDAMFFKNYGVNPFIDTEDDHLSTFAMDVDTASYTVIRGYLHEGHMPPNDAVRVEEFVNYFKYDYPSPKKDDFALYCEASPWQFGTDRKNSYLLRLALKARQIRDENRKPAILTFVIDVSGSMNREDRLGLVKKSLRLLIDNLKPDDKIGIAVYETRGRKVMDYKGLDEKNEILSTIEMLGPGGSTNAEEGIRIGYEMAEREFKPGCINRVILCTDGVANEGQTAAEDILSEIKEKADKGITLSAIGFGMGNFNDVLLEKLGDKGNGHYAYVDTIAEARRIFVENLTGTLQLVARDAKIQVDFNPNVVRSYRLIGYENRDVPDEKFRDDKYDGGEVGMGHSVTALYELKLWPEKKGRIVTTFVRYKKADNGAVTEFKSDFDSSKINHNFDASSRQFRLAATAAEFAEILRHSYWAKGATLTPVLQQAQKLSQEFQENSDVIELADLISKAEQLTPKPPAEIPQEE